MIFNSIDFLIFFPIVILLYFVMPKKVRTLWLLIASYYFYMSWNATYAILIFFSTLVTFGCGILLEKVSRRKLILVLSFVINLGILFSFKYLNFLLENINFILTKTGASPIQSGLNLLLPVGISFYTFQALGYTMDVYRGQIKAETDFLRYALFVSFFPQLVAGPIERSGNLLTQIEKLGRERLFNYEKFVSGFSMMCYGMFMKVVLADRLAIFVDTVWNNMSTIGTVETVAAAIAFSLQIYCDFGAYSTIAIGAARVMGFDLMENFNTPYFAITIADFWRRWHISLSGWFRDYLYIPMGGSRCAKLKKYRNLLVTFLVSGLWHGANWTYVFWGGLHGVYQIVGDLTKEPRRRLEDKMKVNREAESYRLGKIIGTFALTTFAWIFFRAPSMKDAVLYIKYMLVRPDFWALSSGNMYNYGCDRIDFRIAAIGILLLLVFDLVRSRKQLDFGAFMLKQNLWFRWIVLFGLIFGCIIYGAYGVNFDSSQFIYFQF